jgi:hypothetical protein
MPVFHTACHTLDHQPAWLTWAQGAELFSRVASALGPSLISLCVMPDHVHPITDRPVQRELRVALSGYTRWLNHRAGRRGPLFAPVPEGLVRRGKDKVLRDQRYTELNPCRAGLVTDPLEWPLSTWRDRMGLAFPAVRPRAHDPARWHDYACKDDYVRAGPLPYVIGRRAPEDVEEAVSSVLRVPLERLRARGPARTLLIASLLWLSELPATEIGRRLGMSPQAVRRVDPRGVPGLDVIERVAGDPRFRGLRGSRLDWRSYCERQRRNGRGPEWEWK